MMWSEVAQAVRTLARHRGYTAVTVLTLAFGIGANTAIFSAVWRLFVDPLPFAGAERLVDAYRTQGGGGFMVTPQPEVALARKAGARALEGVQLWKPDEQTLTGVGDPAVLIVGALLLVRTFTSLRSEPLGFEPDGALALEIVLPGDRYAEATRREAFFDELLDGIRAIPAVQSASVAGGVPPNIGMMFGELYVEGMVGTAPDINDLAGTVVTPGYFETIGVRRIAGRDFTGTGADELSVVVNRAFVERFWPGEFGVGRRIRLVEEAPWATIVGVIDDMRPHGPRSPLEPDRSHASASSWYCSHSSPAPRYCSRRSVCMAW